MNATRSLFDTTTPPAEPTRAPAPTNGNGHALGSQLESIFSQIAERTAPTMDADAIRTAIDDQIGAAKNDISAKGVSPSLQLSSNALQELTALPLPPGSLRERGLQRSFDVPNGRDPTCFSALVREMK